jgi:L-alanine-DL-glutamate epimerase-like enolase superfamily enzyme
MKIASVEALHLRLGRVENKADGTQEVLVVRVTTDTGLIGYGEAVSNATVSRSIVEAPRSAPFRHGLGVVLVGTDPFDPEARWLDMYNATRWYGRRGAAIHAIAAVDTALWDIVGQSRALACHAVWGTRRHRVRAYASVLFPDTAVEGAALAASLAERGFSAIKFGWGQFGRDRDWDCRMLEEIRAAIGSGVDLMVDAGRVWRSEQAIERAPELFERFNILWLEEPLHEDDLEGYGKLAKAVGQHLRIATGETEERESDFADLIDRGVKVIQPDVGRAGGLTVCRRLSTLAHHRGVWCLPHSFGTGVNLAASAQWMAAAEEAVFMEYPVTPSPLRNELVAGIPQMMDGMVEIGDAPGLGISLDPAVIARFRVA